MSQIKSKNTQPELIVRRFLFSNGLRYRLHNKNLPGKPDIVFAKIKTVIFIHGCFWHGHKNCKYFKLPMTRTVWWKNKIEKNRIRDKAAIKLLKKLKWHTISVFECELKGEKLNPTLNKVINKIINGR